MGNKSWIKYAHKCQRAHTHTYISVHRYIYKQKQSAYNMNERLKGCIQIALEGHKLQEAKNSCYFGWCHWCKEDEWKRRLKKYINKRCCANGTPSFEWSPAKRAAVSVADYIRICMQNSTVVLLIEAFAVALTGCIHIQRQLNDGIKFMLSQII